jgi:hypothetical protein
MATQRITIAKLAGRAGESTVERFLYWESRRGPGSTWSAEVGRQIRAFAERLRSYSTEPWMVYFAEWIDRWSMGDLFCSHIATLQGVGPITVETGRYQLKCFPVSKAVVLSFRSVQQFGNQEAEWFESRLSEALQAWQTVADTAAIVLVREVVGATTTDSEMKAALHTLPDWLNG